MSQTFYVDRLIESAPRDAFEALLRDHVGEEIDVGDIVK